MPYAALCIFSSWFRNQEHPVIFLLSTIGVYAALILLIILTHTNIKTKSLYISLVFLLSDSIVQSLGCITAEMFSKSIDYSLLSKTSSLIYNVIFFFIIKALHIKKEQIQISIRLLPKKLYIMLLITIFIIGELCGNMAVEADEQFFDNKINSFLTILTILFFLVTIISFIFSCISQRYYENISKLMEQQVNDQISHYKRVNKLTQDLREFRHDYKNHMICLQALLDGKQYDDAFNYVKDITKQEIIEANEFSSGNQIADTILSDKNENAIKNGSKITFDGFISDELSASDLCTLLSNALDNAIEACAKISTNEIKSIDVKCAVVQGIQIIRISNPNHSESDSLETTKGDIENHGFGLYNIRKTVEKLDGQMKIPSKTPVFVLELEFKVKL